MSKDCLQTVYKKEVNNDNLPEFGVIALDAANTSGEKSTFYVGGTGVYIDVVDGSLYSGGNNPLSTPYELNSDSKTTLKYSSVSNAKVKIGNKYNLKILQANLHGAATDLEELAYCESVTDIIGLFKGNLSSISRLSALSILRIGSNAGEDNRDVHGSIMNVVNAAFTADGTKFEVGNTYVDGDWLTFIRTRNANSKSLSLLITSFNNNTKFNGKTVALSSAGITFVNNNKIALINTGNSKGFTLGYTDEEIATNTATGGVWAGKSITKCD